tara:strand:- start:4804 stop:5652 length:849 start_codon:yes stop_codon:yes gene_type:complete
LNDKIILISDFFIDDFVGGAALNDEEIYSTLSQHYDVQKIKSRYLYPGFIHENLESFFIISNFFLINPYLLKTIQEKCNYILYCHDYKFVKHTNPAVYPDFIVPSNELINVGIHKNAQAIICQTGFQKDIYDRNLKLPDKTINFSGNLWSDDHLNLLEELDRIEKDFNKCAIVESPYPQKGTEYSKQYCQQNNIPFDIIKHPDYESFLKILSEYSSLAFHPSTPETCCRLVLEAKMIGLKIYTNKLIGASYEPWYELNGTPLINAMRDKKKDLLQIIRNVRR